MGRAFETIIYGKDAAIAKITLNRPEAYNAFTAQMNKEIITALKMASKDKAVRCIVVTGSGKAFCSGQDLAEVDEDTNHAKFLRERYHPMLKAMNELPKPIIAAVNGIAAGAGMSFALAADFRLIHPETRLISAFMDVGLVPDSGLMYMLPRIVGYAKALEISVFGEPINGEQAYDLGLGTELITTDWEKGVAAFANKTAKLPTKSFSLIKRNLLTSMHLSLDEALELEAQAQRIAGMSNDHQEGLRAFSEKQKPIFSGQ